MDGTAPTADRLETLALDVVDESPTNPRKRFDQAKLEELAQDIAANGLIQPVVVRPRGERFELVVGARRKRASALAGRGTILAIVRDLDDRTTLEVQLSENAQRQDVHPLEEADGYAQLIEVHHATAEEVAAKVGKPVGYVRHRLQYRALCPLARDAFFSGKLTPHTALIVARIPVESLQVEAVQEITRANYQGDMMGGREAANLIRGRYMLQLADAPFDRGDAGLVPTAGACTVCPKRTGNQAELFADVKSADVCTDPTCFKAKKDAHWEQTATAAKEKGHKVLSEAAAKKVFSYGGQSIAHGSDYVDLAEKPYEFGGKKSYKGLVGKAHVPPVTIARDGSGAVRELVKKDDLKKALKAAGVKRESASGGDDAYKDEQRKLREKQALRRATVERALAALVDEVEARKPDLGFWRFLAGTFASAGWHDESVLVAKRRGLDTKGRRPSEAIDAHIETLKEGQLRGIVIELLCGTPPHTYSSDYGQRLRDACEHFGINLKGIEKEVAADLKAAKKAKGKKGGKAKPVKAKCTQAQRPDDEESDEPGRDGDEEESDGVELGEDLGDDDGDDGDETETRVWVAMAVWDALDIEARAHLDEPIVGSEVGWHEIGEHMTAVVPGVELLEALRSECRKRGIALHEGEEPPAAAPTPAPPAPVAAVTLYVRDEAWQALTPAAQRVVQSPAAGVSVLNIRPAGAAHRELGPMKPEEAEVLRAAARTVGLEVFDAPPAAGAKPEEPAPASPPQRVLVVHTEGDDWMGARKGLAAWQADKTPGAGFTTGGSAAPLAMLHTPAADSADVAKLLARYEKAGRRVLDLGVVAGDKVFDCDPSNRAIRERWNVAHPHARVSVPEEPKPAKKASTKKGGR